MAIEHLTAYRELKSLGKASVVKARSDIWMPSVQRITHKIGSRFQGTQGKSVQEAHKRKDGRGSSKEILPNWRLGR